MRLFACAQKKGLLTERAAKTLAYYLTVSAVIEIEKVGPDPGLKIVAFSFAIICHHYYPSHLFLPSWRTKKETNMVLYQWWTNYLSKNPIPTTGGGDELR